MSKTPMLAFVLLSLSGCALLDPTQRGSWSSNRAPHPPSIAQLSHISTSSAAAVTASVLFAAISGATWPLGGAEPPSAGSPRASLTFTDEQGRVFQTCAPADVEGRVWCEALDPSSGSVLRGWSTRAGHLDGPTRARCSDGAIRFEGAYADGKRSGRWRSMRVDFPFAERGDLATTTCVCPQEEGNYASGVEVGRWRYWTRCRLTDVVTYHYDDVTGLQESFYETSGARRSSGRFVNGLREGEHTTWFESGRLHRRSTYRAGIAIGIEDVHADDGP